MASALLCLLILCACTIHVYSVEFNHDFESEEYILKSNGILKTIVALTKDNGVKRLLCKQNLILVALENITIANSWKVGDIVVGDPDWGCALARDDKDVHAEYGFHAIIDNVQIKTDKRVDIYTKPAKLFDIFERASIFYHHKQTPVDQTKGHLRKKRAVIPFEATGSDIPIGGVEFNSTKEFYEARVMLNKIEWHEKFRQIVMVNYDDEKDGPVGSFGFKDGAFVHNSSYFEDVESVSNLGAQKWELHCDKCFVYFKPEVTFQMEIDTLIGVKKYLLEMSGEFETNIDFTTHIHGEHSVKFDDLIYSSPEHLWVSVPLVPEIHMSLIPSFQVDIGAFIDIMAQGKVDLDLGFHQAGNLTITRDWTPTGQVQDYSFVPTDADKQHAKTANLGGHLYYNISTMNTVINLKDDIFWKMPKNIFGFYLTSPMQVRVSPHIEGMTSMNEHKVSCLTSYARINGQVLLENVDYMIELLGEQFDTKILDSKTNETFYFLERYPIVDSDVCKLQCHGPGQTDAHITLESVLTHGVNPNNTAATSNKETTIRDSDRMVFQDDDCKTTSYNMAVKLDKLASWVLLEWPDRKLVVAGCSGIGGIGGKRADVGATAPGAADNQIDPSTLEKVGQLAVCLNLPYVSVESAHVVIAVYRDEEYEHPEKELFEEALGNLEPEELMFCDENIQYFKELSVGESQPDEDVDFIMSVSDNRVLRNNDEEFVHRLYQYPFDDIEFELEEQSSDWCGTESRGCDACIPGENYAWSRCADMVMTARLATKLHELAGLVTQKWPAEKIKVLEAWDENTSDFPTGRHPKGSLHYEGRAAWLTLVSGDTVKLSELTSLATCAGFDMVSYPSSDYIQVFVHPQRDLFTTEIPFQSSETLIATDPELFYEYEYSYPELDDEPEPIDLLDGYADNHELQLSEHFQVLEFQARDRRYFRLDTKLLDCLELARHYVRTPIELVSGYKTRMHSNYEDIPQKERDRFRSGQAVNIKLEKWQEREDHLMQIAHGIIRACAVSAKLDQRVVGLALHPEWVHFQIRRAEEEELDTYVQVWNEGGDVEVFGEMQRLTNKILTEGPPIVPHFWEVACEIPELGYDKFYFQIQIRPSCRDISEEFCKKTKTERQELVAKVRDQMQPILGFADGPPFLKDKDIEDCIDTHCGSCNGAGSIWRKKLVSCSNVIHTIRRHLYRELKPDLYRELKPDRGAFFNIDHIDSHVQALACRGLVCLEDLQIYAVFAPIILATYTPYPGRAQRERLYDSNSNPNPIIDLIEQEMAMHVSGDVHIFFEKDEDLSALRNVVKILMLYNKDVDKIIVHANKTMLLDTVYERFQDWIETWRYQSCPTWSRFTMAPYEVVVIPEEDIAASMHEHRDALRMRRSIRNWELAWILKK